MEYLPSSEAGNHSQLPACQVYPRAQDVFHTFKCLRKVKGFHDMKMVQNSSFGDCIHCFTGTKQPSRGIEAMGAEPSCPVVMMEVGDSQHLRVHSLAFS